MTALRLSLRALSRPVTLFSLAVLLLNDHWLKQAAPSALTGKLSDFAGLFFFPFLLTALLSPLADARRAPPRSTFALAWAITLVWFALVKTAPWANALTTAALEWALGLPVQIVRDPSDCAALVVLWPAWWLWRRLEHEPAPPAPGRAAYLALGIAALATLATSPLPPRANVVRLAVDDDAVYAGIIYWYGGPIERVVVSTDGGRQWEEALSVSAVISDALQTPLTPPALACDPLDDEHCFRLNTSTQVEESVDGGATWRVGWAVPWGREAFMRRPRFILGYPQPDPIVSLHDLAFVQRDGRFTLIVAAGEQGVLARTPDGAWERYAVLNAVPVSYSTSDPLQVLASTFTEAGLALAASGAALLGLGAWVWAAVIGRARRNPAAAHSIAWALRPVLIIGLIIVLGIGLIVLRSFILLFPPITSTRYAVYQVLSTITGWLWIGLPLLACVGAGWSWRRLISLTADPHTARRLGWQALGAALLVWPCFYWPFPLWAMWVIPAYEIALGVAVAVALGLLSVMALRLRRLIRQLDAPEGAG